MFVRSCNIALQRTNESGPRKLVANEDSTMQWIRDGFVWNEDGGECVYHSIVKLTNYIDSDGSKILLFGCVYFTTVITCIFLLNVSKFQSAFSRRWHLYAHMVVWYKVIIGSVSVVCQPCECWQRIGIGVFARYVEIIGNINQNENVVVVVVIKTTAIRVETNHRTGCDQNKT